MKNLIMLIDVISAHKKKQVEGRIRLQKTIYLLKYFHFPFEEKYKYLHFGPYSEELSYEIKELKAYGLINETGGPPTGPYLYEVTSKGEKFIESFFKDRDPVIKSKISQFVQTIESFESKVLELLSTVYFLMNAGYSNNDAWKMLKKLKPTKDAFTEDAKKLDKQLPRFSLICQY